MVFIIEYQHILLFSGVASWSGSLSSIIIHPTLLTLVVVLWAVEDSILVSVPLRVDYHLILVCSYHICSDLCNNVMNSLYAVGNIHMHF